MTKRKTRTASKPPPPPATPPATLRGAGVRYAAGGLYIAVAAFLWLGKATGSEAIGAVCGGECAAVRAFGVPLEVAGIAAMAAVLGCSLAVGRWVNAAVLCAMLALLHAGASLAFAASQWLGIAPLCVPCQVAMLLSLIVAGTTIPLMPRGPLALPLLAPVLIGAISVAAIWPHLTGLPEVEEPVLVADPPTENPPSPSTVTPLLDALTVGNPAAPFELVMLTDFNCPICRRFETRTMPKLLARAVQPGVLRVRFIYKVPASGVSYELVAATALARAGADPIAIQELFHDRTLRSAPQGIALWPDEDVRARATEILTETGDWNALHAEHRRLGNLLRGRYFSGSQATPLFALFPGEFDADNLPAEESLYIFKGFQLPAPFLEFVGVTTDE